MIIRTTTLDPLIDTDEPFPQTEAEKDFERTLIDTYCSLRDLEKVATTTASPRHAILIDKARRIVGEVLAEQ